jgi:hypothetical protein
MATPSLPVVLGVMVDAVEVPQVGVEAATLDLTMLVSEWHKLACSQITEMVLRHGPS